MAAWDRGTESALISLISDLMSLSALAAATLLVDDDFLHLAVWQKKNVRMALMSLSLLITICLVGSNALDWAAPEILDASAPRVSSTRTTVSTTHVRCSIRLDTMCDSLLAREMVMQRRPTS